MLSPGLFGNEKANLGVGIAPVMDGELGQAKTYAEDEGRNDLSRQIETKVGSMIKKYNQQTSSGGETISETQRTNVSQSLSKTTLNGSVPKKAHYSEKQEKYYSLICLKPGVFSSAFDAMEQMSEKQRNAIRERAKEAEQELDDALKSYDDM